MNELTNEECSATATDYVRTCVILWMEGDQLRTDVKYGSECLVSIVWLFLYKQIYDLLKVFLF